MAIELLLGNVSTGDSGNSSGTFYLGRFQAIATSSTSHSFYVRCSGSGTVKIAVYADNSGEPGALIVSNNTDQNVVSGDNTLTITSSSIVTGTWYWLGINSSAVIVRRNTTGGTTRYKTATYSTFTFPDPAGSSFNTSATNQCLALYGETGVTPPAITSISDTTLDDSQTGVTIVCTDASVSGNTVHINSASDGSGTDVEQTITSESATEIIFTVGFGALTAGTAYLAIESSTGVYSSWSAITLNSTTPASLINAYLDPSGLIVSNGSFSTDYIGKSIKIFNGEEREIYNVVFANTSILILDSPVETDDNIITLINL